MCRTEFVPSIREITAMADEGLVSLSAARWLLSTHAAMLEALEQLLKYVDASNLDGGWQTKNARAAIRLAKGGSHV